MRIAIIAMGTRGDVQPYIALGKGLKASGHFIRLITHENFEMLVTSHGLNFGSVKGNAQEVLESPEMLKLLEQGNFLAINAHTGKMVKDIAITYGRLRQRLGTRCECSTLYGFSPSVIPKPAD
jgi:sterol 3beta-glucosyltransferase